MVTKTLNICYSENIEKVSEIILIFIIFHLSFGNAHI
jgi:hypothetical protein